MQVPIWIWLMGPFVQAHLRVYQDLLMARNLLELMADHLQAGCVGALGEQFSGAPMVSKGAFAHACAVAEVVRAWCLIENLSPQT